MKTVKPFFFILLIALAFSFAACKGPTDAPVTTASAVIGNQTVLDEIGRLDSLDAKGTATVADFAGLEQMVTDDDHAKDELGEIETMVKYQEFEHASHGLSFLAGYAKTGKSVICPGHELSHYYVFMRHGEDERAADALKAAKEDLPVWLPLAKSYNDQYPAAAKFDDIVANINSHIARIDAGNTTATDDEIDYLTSAGSICVSAE